MKMIEMVQSQIEEEFGEEWEEKEINPKTLLIIAQKFGLRVPQLTQSEMYLIFKEQQDGRKNV